MVAHVHAVAQRPHYSCEGGAGVGAEHMQNKHKRQLFKHMSHFMALHNLDNIV